jgi:hypothetical protein
MAKTPFERFLGYGIIEGLQIRGILIEGFTIEVLKQWVISKVSKIS